MTAGDLTAHNPPSRPRPILPMACAALAILAAMVLVAPGLYLLGVSLVLGEFQDFSTGIRFGPPTPPTPTEAINDARNAAELASMKRQAVTLIVLGAVLILIGLLGARRFRSRVRAPAEMQPDPRVAEEIQR